MSGAPLVSVVVPTHNRAGVLASCLASLVALDYPRDTYELLVVDAASSDDTPERVRALSRTVHAPAIAYLRSSRDANAARNTGIDAARGELIALIDDDVIVPRGWLTAVMRGARDWPQTDCFGGPVRPIMEARPPATCAKHQLAGIVFDEGAQERRIGEVWGGNLALRRSALGRAGHFREGLRVQQEWEWQRRLSAAGGEIVYLPDAWLWHRRSANDLRLTAMVREFFLRGYVRGSLDHTVTASYALRRTRRWLGHAARTRCARGVTEVARSTGLACAVIRRRVPTPR